MRVFQPPLRTNASIKKLRCRPQWVNPVTLAVCRSRPIYPCERTSSDRSSMSQTGCDGSFTKSFPRIIDAQLALGCSAIGLPMTMRCRSKVADGRRSLSVAARVLLCSVEIVDACVREEAARTDVRCCTLIDARWSAAICRRTGVKLAKPINLVEAQGLGRQHGHGHQPSS